MERKTLALYYDRIQAYYRNTSAADIVPEETFEPDFVPTFRVVETTGHSELFAIIYLGQCPPFFWSKLRHCTEVEYIRSSCGLNAL